MYKSLYHEIFNPTFFRILSFFLCIKIIQLSLTTHKSMYGIYILRFLSRRIGYYTHYGFLYIFICGKKFYSITITLTHFFTINTLYGSDTFQYKRFWQLESFSEYAIKFLCYIASDLNMLLLVLSNRYHISILY